MIWEFDHARLCTMAEWEYWQRHTLPFGWALLSKPPEDKP